MATPDSLTLMATGELMPCMPDSPEFYFEAAAPTLGTADIVVGHLETPHTRRPAYVGDPRLPAPDPDNLNGLLTAHYSGVTLAGNPAFSYGTPGIEDTIAWLDEHGIAHVGTGMNIDEATTPMVIERKGTTFGFLSYDCIGGANNAATPTKPGCAYVDIITHYHARGVGGAPVVYTWPERFSQQAMCEEIDALRSRCDVLVVALHMGLVRQEVVLADYETQLSRAAIDAGADLILGYHSHVLKGVEFYQGKAIFHCLGNFVTVYPWEAHYQFKERPNTTRARSRYRDQPGSRRVDIDTEYPMYSYAPPSRNAVILRCSVEEASISGLHFLPCIINKKAQPEVVGRDSAGERVFNYIDHVTRAAGLNAKFAWDGDEIAIGE